MTLSQALTMSPSTALHTLDETNTKLSSHHHHHHSHSHHHHHSSHSSHPHHHHSHTHHHLSAQISELHTQTQKHRQQHSDENEPSQSKNTDKNDNDANNTDIFLLPFASGPTPSSLGSESIQMFTIVRRVEWTDQEPGLIFLYWLLPLSIVV
jgi:hypothetical protein